MSDVLEVEKNLGLSDEGQATKNNIQQSLAPEIMDGVSIHQELLRIATRLNSLARLIVDQGVM